MRWWTGSAQSFEKRLLDIPEVFRTIGFWGEIKRVEGSLRALKPIFSSMHSGAFTLVEAMDHVGRNFSGDPERLKKWRSQMESLESLLFWLPAFMNACDYVNAALPLDHNNLDRARALLLQSMEDPCSYLEARMRDEFEMRFLEFKRNYVNTYCLLHEDTLHSKDTLKKNETKIDPISLRNLELLSGLLYADKSYFNRVKLLAKWIHRHQCNLPVRQILEHYPRCYCNFNPQGNQQPTGLIEQINRITQDGIDFFRFVLRRCSHLITGEMETKQVCESDLMQITSILDDSPMIALKPQCLHILNRIIAKYPNEFRAEMRKAAKRNRQTH